MKKQKWILVCIPLIRDLRTSDRLLNKVKDFSMNHHFLKTLNVGQKFQEAFLSYFILHLWLHFFPSLISASDALMVEILPGIVHQSTVVLSALHLRCFIISEYVLKVVGTP